MTSRALFFIPPQSDLLLWLDAADSSSVIRTGSTVTQWRDKSPSARHSNSLTGTTTYSATGFNGRPALIFNQTRIAGPLENTGSSDYTGSTFHAFCVFNPSAAAGGNTRILSLGKDGTEDWNNANSISMFIKMSGTGGIAIYRSSVSAETASVSINTNVIAQSSCSSTDVSVSIFGGTVATTTTTAANHQIRIWAVGQNTTTATALTGFQGAISEVLLFNRRLTDLEAQSVEIYLARKWGLTGVMDVGHPTQTRPNNVGISRVPFWTRFNPTTVSGLALWLDGADPAGNGVLPADGAVVTTWVNKVVGNNNWIASGTANRYSSSSRSITFDGTANSRFTATLPASYSELSIFAVAQQNSGKGPIYSFNDEYGFHPHNVNPAFLTGGYYVASGNSSWMSGVSPYTLGTAFMSSIIYDATTVSFFATGAFINSATKLTIVIQTINLGSSVFGPQERLTGHISEFLIFSRALSATERQTIESYLADKWGFQRGLPAGHAHTTAPAGRERLNILVPPPSRVETFPRFPPFIIISGILGTQYTVNTIASGRVFLRFYVTGMTYQIQIPQARTFSVFAIGGGGAGGTYFGFGGNAGSVVEQTTVFPAGIYNITVGAGGPSVFNGNWVTATGGDGGATTMTNGVFSINVAGGAGGIAQGNQSVTTGGVGAGGTFSGRDGGPGISKTFNAGVEWFGGGGGGSGYSARGIGGSGVGGNSGINNNQSGSAGVNGTGSGGGGGSGAASSGTGRGGAGGSGVLILFFDP